MRHDIKIRGKVRTVKAASSDVYGVAQRSGIEVARAYEKEFNEKWGISVDADGGHTCSDVYETHGVVEDAETGASAHFRTLYVTGYCFEYDPETGEYESIDDSCYSFYEVLEIDAEEGSEQHRAFESFLEETKPIKL